MPRAVKITLWIIVVISLLATAFYQIENWRGRVAVAEIYAEIKADGEPMTIDQLDNTSPPDKENFFKAPLVSSLLDYQVKYSKESFGLPNTEVIYDRPDERERLLAIRFSDQIKLYGSFFPETGSKGLESKEKADFEVWAEVFRADPEYTISDTAKSSDSALVLAAINSRFAREWTELKKAASRPDSFIEVEWSGDYEELVSRPRPVYNDWMQMCKLLTLRISAAIEEDDFQTFRETVQIYIQFEKGMESDYALIANLVRSASHKALLGALWNGLESKSIPEKELQWLASKLREFDSATATLNNYREERVLLSQPGFEQSKRSAEYSATVFFNEIFSGGTQQFLISILPVVPDGWWDQNSAAVERFTHREIVSRWKSMDFSGTKGLKTRIPRRKIPYTVIAHSLTNVLVSINERFMHVYVMNQLAILACEIEIYALKNGGYPDALTDLVPSQLKTIPLDPFDGKPMKYRKVDDRYVVYSVGLNESDDHGAVVYRNPGRIDKKSGDWAWGYQEVKKRDISERRMKFLDAIRKKIDSTHEAQN